MNLVYDHYWAYQLDAKRNEQSNKEFLSETLDALF